MQVPATPVDEAQRLRSLIALDILDTMPEERFDRITRLACRAFGVPIALVTLVGRERNWFKSKHGFDACEADRRSSFCGHAILHEGPLVVADALLDPRFADNPFVEGAPGIRFYAGQPVHGVDGFRIGTLCLVDLEPRRLAEQDLTLLSDLAAMIDREFALIARASTDEITSLANRRGFAEMAGHVLALCRRNTQPAVAIGIDLDHFKSINDHHGHEAGDEALRLFSKLLLESFRASDVVARLGGDEFAILCSGTSSDQVEASLARLRAEFKASVLARRHPDLSWSAGTAFFDPSSDATIEDLLRTADVRMYAVKAASRRVPISASDVTANK
jgi:diguanylate cyclase (GGDEF)-like protein